MTGGAICLSLKSPASSQIQPTKIRTGSEMKSHFHSEAIGVLMDRESERANAKRRILARMENAPGLRTGGVIRWTREELYER